MAVTKNKIILRRLRICVAKAGGDPCGGYVNMAISVGAQLAITKSGAKAFLKLKFPESLDDVAVVRQKTNTEIVAEIKRHRASKAPRIKKIDNVWELHT